MRNARRSIRTLTALCTIAVSLIAPAAALARYAAIAIDPVTCTWGTSYHAATRAIAERKAKHECRGRCRVLIWVRDQCAAAVETRAAFWGGFGPSRTAAIRDARRRAHDRHARFIVWTCSG
ncbi:MAG: DUF4189 domain-containing protein [Solirubrobacteraceae bacterium]